MFENLSKISKIIFLPLLLIFFILASCSNRYIHTPDLGEKITLDEMIHVLKDINHMEALLSVEYESKESLMSGDASLVISRDTLNLRIYYLGFLVGEISEKDGIITSNPKISKNKGTILIDGLRNSLFWWEMGEFIRENREDNYVLKNTYKMVFIDKKTLLPIKQIIELSDGERLEIFYEMPRKIEESEKNNLFDIWYNSKITFKLKNHTAIINIKNLKII